MSNIKQYTIRQLCSDLVEAFGEDFPLESIESDKYDEFVNDYWLGHFNVTTFKIS